MAACPDCGFEPVRVGLLRVRPGERVYAPAFRCDACQVTRKIEEGHGELIIACRDVNRRRMVFFAVAGLIWFCSNVALMFATFSFDLPKWLMPLGGFGGLLVIAFLMVRKIQATVFK